MFCCLPLTRNNRWRNLVCVAVLQFVVSCSLAQDWDINNLPCDQSIVDGNTNFCLAGYTCFSGNLTCIRNYSRKEGQACSDALQCESGMVCPMDQLDGQGVPQQGDVQTCLPPCNSQSPNNGYLQADACDALKYCAPFLTAAKNSAQATMIGGCVPSDGCSIGDSCTIDGNPGGICVPISSSAQACLPLCTISYSNTAAYSDNCGSDSYCQPVGLQMQKEFVCLNNDYNQVATGAACSIVQAPCQDGDVCAPNGVCAPYCELTTNTSQVLCPTNQKCCPFTDIGVSVASGYCASACGS